MNIDWIINRCNEVLLSVEKEKAPLTSVTAKELNFYISEAGKHGVLPLVIDSLLNIKDVAPDFKKIILIGFGACERSKGNYRKRIALMKQLSLHFNDAGIDVMFLKGAALAQLYPNPEIRVFNDVDFYLYGSSARGIELMSESGTESKGSYHHHTKAVHDGVLLENHYDFLERINHKCDIIIDNELKSLAVEEGKTCRAKFLGDEIKNAYIMTPTMNALFLMQHMIGHFASETIPLRMLYDWAIFLKIDGDKVDWNRVIALYEKTGTSTFAGIIQAILRLYLRVDIGDCPIKEVDGQIVDKVWDSIQNPPAMNPYKQFSCRYFVFEAKVFIENRWKYELAYPNESFMRLTLRSAWSVLKRKLGLLKV